MQRNYTHALLKCQEGFFFHDVRHPFGQMAVECEDGSGWDRLVPNCKFDTSTQLSCAVALFLHVTGAETTHGKWPWRSRSFRLPCIVQWNVSSVCDHLVRRDWRGVSNKNQDAAFTKTQSLGSKTRFRRESEGEINFLKLRTIIDSPADSHVMPFHPFSFALISNTK